MTAARPGALKSAIQRAMHASPVPAMIVDLLTYEVVDGNRGALEFFAAREGHPVDLAEHLPIDPRHRDLADLVASGRIDGFDARLPVEVAGGSTRPVHVWVRALTDNGSATRFAVVMMTEGIDIDPTIRLPLTRPARMVAGATDDEWVVEWVTREVSAVLGYDRAQFVGTPLLGIAHPDTAADLVRALMHAADKQGGAVLQARLRRADHRWQLVQMIVSPRPAEATGAMFLLLPEPRHGRGEEDSHDRVWHAAGEVHAAALVRDGDLPTDAVADLSSRQWEIVTRLQRGERVPGIASAMYLSQSTVRNHLTAVFRKFGVHSQPELLSRLRAGAAHQVSPPIAE